MAHTKQKKSEIQRQINTLEGQLSAGESRIDRLMGQWALEKQKLRVIESKLDKLYAQLNRIRPIDD